MKEAKTEIVVLLDSSGSMQWIFSDTLGGFNRFLEDQKAEDGEACLSMVQFNYNPKTTYWRKPIAKAPKLSRANFKPSGGTALLDAWGATMLKLDAALEKMSEDEQPENVIFVVLTDGQENASKEYKKHQIFDMVSKYRKEKNWEFLYLGANQDAIAEGAGLGVSEGSTMTFNASSDGVSGTYDSISRAVRQYRRGYRGDYFSEADREKAKKGS